MQLLPSRLLSLLAAGVLAAASAHAQAPRRPLPGGADAPSDEQSYSKEFVYGVNFNTQGGLLGGASVRSTRVLGDRMLRFWSIEGVMLKNRSKEITRNTVIGGSYIDRKTNYAFALRPSVGMQRILFRKAAEAGVQVNGLLSVGPSLGLLLPYYISYDLTASGPRVNLSTDNIVNEQYDPYKHTDAERILDRGPLFSGIGDTKVVPGFHLRGGLSFEYGRYRDAVTGLEVGFLVESFTKRLVILSPGILSDRDDLNRQFFPSVYLTLYFGHRS